MIKIMNKKRYIQPVAELEIDLGLDQLMIEATSSDSTNEQLIKEREEEELLYDEMTSKNGSWYLW